MLLIVKFATALRAVVGREISDHLWLIWLAAAARVCLSLAMTISVSAIESAAPDQASLQAATKLLSPAKWPERIISEQKDLIWGACQGSGANPYRVVVDLSDLGSKCSCPSRKFPCKHALALMLQFSGKPADFTQGSVPDWVSEWLGRRRKTGGAATAGGAAGHDGKSLAAAQAVEAEKPVDPKVAARNEAAAAKRAQATQASVADGLAEMEAWIADQLRTGLAEMLGDLTARCRRIASRLVDAKAAALAGRIDGIPARVLALQQKDRGDALIAELGKLVILSRAWGQAVPGALRAVTAAETREALLENPHAPRHSGAWEVVASRDETRRDGLIARSTWLLGLGAEPRFALLQDFFPASLGKQVTAFAIGQQFDAEVIYYPSSVPMRAQVLTRSAREDRRPWPQAVESADILRGFSDALAKEPWLSELPILLPQGRIAKTEAGQFWVGAEGGLPMTKDLEEAILGAELRQTLVLWDGYGAALLAADTNFGKVYADA